MAELRERRFGVLEGQSVTKFRSEAKSVCGQSGQWWKYTPQGGETIEEVKERAKKFFQVGTVN